MLPEELLRLRKEKGDPCISLIVPLSGKEKKTDHLVMQEAIEKTGNFLQGMYPASLTERLLISLRQLGNEIVQNNDPIMEGVGIYISPEINMYFSFPFPVREKISIGDAFEIRELLFLQHYAVDYFLLHINRKKVSCFRGTINKLEEIKDDHFPMSFQQEYEYSRPASGSSYAGYAVLQNFEKDKSFIEADRLKSFYREADKVLGGYISSAPLVIAGPKKDIAILEDVSYHTKNIIATFNGNYTYSTLHELEKRAWASVRAWVDNQEHISLLELMQKDRSQVIEGLKHVWKAAREGKGLKLIVEKDYACPAFTDIKGEKLFLKPPKSHYRVIIDVVDEIMKTVIEKNGEIKFVKNDALQEYQHIALITRY
ncbi:hypothetical protein HGH93_31170 [Chitinophaga polysaccharea]|uniref:baeRF3 domain-containing protein n=1 Tax=Chitinophaga TaxID=79328 RepID=UPI001454E849|nr:MULTISPECIES: hypothetical protein [Chitinophaga]NLR62595.1 hypothetical protein [Chitinophaga polysaccharea]NLU91471.1 hypothetical protein [Chitinophaga sp. Ak27]